ncbi:MAG: twin transmembrane helix small protein [Pseudomonadota bacterium]
MSILTILIVLAMLSTLGVLVMGVGSMAHGGKYDDEHSQQFMYARVGLQGVTFLLLVAALLLH